MDSSTTLKSIEDLNLIAFTLESYTHQEEWSPLAITTCSGFPYSYSDESNWVKMTPEACTIQVHQSRLGLYRLVVLNQQQEPSLQFNIDQNFIFQMSKENFGQWKIDFSIFGFQFISNEEGTKFFQLFQNYLSLINSKPQLKHATKDRISRKHRKPPSSRNGSSTYPKYQSPIYKTRSASSCLDKPELKEFKDTFMEEFIIQTNEIKDSLLNSINVRRRRLQHQ